MKDYLATVCFEDINSKNEDYSIIIKSTDLPTAYDTAIELVKQNHPDTHIDDIMVMVRYSPPIV